ncbi:MAG: ParB/RepB/Spo0J family partition protein [Lachnospiraceae bacterium]|nr:ParB/RepB/Spo0J family partition protein [Lachnospiraceae bacterium]
MGMGALISTDIKNMNESAGGSVEIDINKISPNPEQPRRFFEENALEELAASIKEYGIIQPLILKKSGDYYEIIAGERRWRASKIAGLKKVPAIVREYDEKLGFEVALIENLQREDLNPVEEALGYKKLAEMLKLNAEGIADKVGKSRPAVANAMRLLNLDEKTLELVKEGRLSAGHARALLTVEAEDTRLHLAQRVIDEGLSVRAVEALVKKAGLPLRSAPSKIKTEGSEVIENQLKEILGTKVKLKAGAKKGKIEIEYYSNDDLDRIISLLKGKQ